MKQWTIQSRAIDETVKAQDQFAAWNTLRTRPLSDFGLIVTALPNGKEEQAVAIQTARLMRSWGREDDAIACDDVAREQGLL